MRLNNYYTSGRTVRYHCNPDFSGLGQTVADHTWGCLALLFYFHPNPSVNLVKAVTFHDSGERWAGDIPYSFKKEMPEAWEMFKKFEEAKAKEMGIPVVELTEEEKGWLEFVDKYEAVMFCKHMRPDIFNSKDLRGVLSWKNQEKYCMKLLTHLREKEAA